MLRFHIATLLYLYFVVCQQRAANIIIKK